jgi:3-deoxy-D-manno-octulosonic-acid transferase
MKWLLYNILFAVAYAAMVPCFLLRMKRRGGYRARMGDRFGRYPADVLARLGEGRRIWVHAVSVGEVQVAGQLMRAMRERDPGVRFAFSTTSSTGWKQAEGQVCEGDVLIYNPLDFGGCVRRALEAVNPDAIVLTESEIWPNFIRAAKKRGIPLYIVNARVSDRSAPRYRRLRWFFGEVLRAFSKIYAQSDLDADRLAAAGADPRAVEVTGSFKFDVARRNPAKEAELREWIGPGDVLLGGSTWPGEDAVMLRIYRELAVSRPDVKLVIAPRHFEKADAVEANVVAAGFACVRRSRGDASPASGTPAAYLCDTTGEMMGLFGIATVAFVGKSLCAHGSQNMIEPCLCGKPTLVGPYTENFRPVMSDLLAGGAVIQVRDEDELKSEILRLFGDAGARAALGARAEEAVRRRCGVVGRCAEEMLEALNGGRTS